MADQTAESKVGEEPASSSSSSSSPINQLHTALTSVILDSPANNCQAAAEKKAAPPDDKPATKKAELSKEADTSLRTEEQNCDVPSSTGSSSRKKDPDDKLKNTDSPPPSLMETDARGSESGIGKLVDYDDDDEEEEEEEEDSKDVGTGNEKKDTGNEKDKNDGNLSLSPDTLSSSGSKLKKDDSGICVRESFTSDDSKCEDDEGGANSTRCERPSVSTESEGLVADIPDTEDSEANPNPDSHSSHSSGEENEEIRVRPSRNRKRRQMRTSSSSSSSSSSSNTSGPDPRMSNSEDSDSEKSDEQEEMEVDKDMPKDKWRILQEVRGRETRASNILPLDRLFRQRSMASLGLVQRLELQHKLEHHDGCVNALNFNKSGTLLASGSDDLNVVVWNWAEKKPYLIFDSGHRSNVFQCKFMPYTGDTHIVTCARDGYVRLAELSSTGVCKGTKKLACHRSSAHKLALLQDSSHVFYSCGEDALVYEIDLREDKPHKLSLTKENDRRVALYSIHANPFKSWEYCVGGRDHYIRIYDKRMVREHEAASIVKRFCPHHLVDSDIKANVTCAVYNYNGTEVLGTYNDEDIYLFNNDHSDGAEFIHRYTGHRNNSTVKGVNFYGPKSEYIVSGSDCSNVYLWEKESEKIVHYFHADDGGVVNVLEPHPNCPVLATSGLDSDVKIWAPTAREATTLKSLRSTTRRNLRDRSNERSNEPEMIDGHMLWQLMQSLRRSTRRRARQEGGDHSSSSSDSDNDSDDSDNPPEPVQCVPS